jgi:N-dimethylarginine dimethylaminohydrolase
MGRIEEEEGEDTIMTEVSIAVGSSSTTTYTAASTISNAMKKKLTSATVHVQLGYLIKFGLKDDCLFDIFAVEVKP